LKDLKTALYSISKNNLSKLTTSFKTGKLNIKASRLQLREEGAGCFAKTLQDHFKAINNTNLIINELTAALLETELMKKFDTSYTKLPTCTKAMKLLNNDWIIYQSNKLLNVNLSQDEVSKMLTNPDMPAAIEGFLQNLPTNSDAFKFWTLVDNIIEDGT